jgi:uncharacterized UPF0160 family protein
MFTFMSKKIKVAVHDGVFHPDDVFSIAILSLYLKKPLEIFRTRDPKVLAKMDYVLDVGRSYNPDDKKFDHHQENWNEKRQNGIPYATSGLVWKEFGEKITGSKDVADRIDEKIIQTIDAEDNGVEICKSIFENVSPYCVSDYIFSFNPTWTGREVKPQKSFERAVEEAKKILKREIKKAEDNILSKKKIQEIYEKTSDKRILVLDDNYSWKKTVKDYPEPLFVIKQVKENKNWHINAVNIDGSRFANRMDFPKSWAGKEDEELEKITGISDAIFCHNGRFMCSAKTKEGAIELAKLALRDGLK